MSSNPDAGTGLHRRGRRFSDPDREAIIDGVVAELSTRADRFHLLRPLSHESLCFRYDYPHPTEPGVFDFEFVVDAWRGDEGVVVVVFVEH